MMDIHLSAHEKKALNFIDQLVTAGSSEFDEIIEAQEIVNRLKGHDPRTYGVLQRLIDSNNFQNNELSMTRNNVITLQGEVASLKNDIRDLIKAVSTLYNHPYSTELNNLKQKNNIY